VLGILDDVLHLTPRQKLAGQILAALVVVVSGSGVNILTNPLGESFQIGWLGVPLTMLWIVGVINAVNLIDGLDGLAAGIGLIAALGLAAVAFGGNPALAVLSLILAGSLMGFLPHNFYPAKIFLGDSGSMFIGFTLAVIGLQGSFKATAATVLFLPIIVLGIPLFDTLFAIFRRARRRTNPFKADREHIHHRLVRVGLHHRNVVLVLYFVCAYLALTAYAIAQIPYQSAFLFLVLLTMGGIIGLRTLRFIEERLEIGTPVEGVPEQPSKAAPMPVASRPRPVRANGGSYATLACEVSGFRHDFGTSQDTDSVRNDITAMLSRRLSVNQVAVLPTSPGQVLLLIRTGQLKPSLVELARDGICWYLEEQRPRFGGNGQFPAVRWIDMGKSAPDHPAPSSGTGGGEVLALSFEKKSPGLAG
jgi:UDP-GlcNAc:undecaprenyl-phosphate GlcNAc-1-phosphate transferase